MADIFELLKRKAKEQYAQGQPYRDLMFRGDPSGVLNKLEAWKNLPMDERVAQATDIGMGFAGTMKGVGKTPFEMAHKIAQKNAALPVEKGGLGLPKNNTAMDRAKAMGFDTKVYHGTTKGTEDGIQEFDLSLAGKQTGNPNSVLGVFTTPNPMEASRYTKDFGKQEYPAVYPLMMRTGKQYEMPYSEADNLAMQLLFNKQNPKGLALQKRNELLSEGYDSIKVKINPDEFVSINPSGVRSVNAAFDPFRRNEADILAGLLAVPATQLLEDDKDKKKRKTK